MGKKLDREFKEDFDNELREATYATRKIGTKILIGIVILVILGGIGGVGYTLTIGKWQKNAEREVFKDSVAATNDIMMEFTRTQCRTIIKNIFYKYNETKILPLYEKKTLMCVEDLYINKTKGNSFARLLLDEMATWTVDYESSHPEEDEH